MPNFQQVIIMGHLGRDPEIRYTSSGSAVCNFSVAVSEKWTSDGEKKEHTEWFNCTAWEKTAELITKSLKKGEAAQFVGKLRTREYEKDGQRRKATDLIVDRLIFVGGGKSTDAPKSRETEQEPPF